MFWSRVSGGGGFYKHEKKIKIIEKKKALEVKLMGKVSFQKDLWKISLAMSSFMIIQKENKS